MKNAEETLTDEEFENFEKLFKPCCVSTYRTDLHAYEGCLFYNGISLCVLKTPWRKDDTYCISEMHACEFEMAQKKDTQIAQGIPAKILAYILQTYPGYFTPKVDWKFVQYLELCGDEYIEEDENSLMMTDIDTEDLFLQHWAEFLSKDFKNPKNGEMSMDWEGIILMAGAYIEALYKKTYRFGQTGDKLEDADFSIRANIFGYLDPLIVSTNRLSKNISYVDTYESLPVYSIDINDFETWQFEMEDGFFKRGLMGFTAYIAALAMEANKERPLSMDEYFMYARGENTRFEETNEANERLIEEDFCNYDFIKTILEPKEHDFEIKEASIAMLNLKTLSFTIAGPKQKLFSTYVEIISPTWKYLIAKLPNFPEALNREDIYYSFVLLSEQKMLELSKQSLFWKSIVPCQQKILIDYSLRFQAYLKHEHKADIALIQEILEEDSISIMELLAIHPDTIDVDASVTPQMSRKMTFKEPTSQETVLPHWPLYTEKATEKEKRFFEEQLHKWCTSTKRTATKSLKNYLKLKEDEGLITRPTQINDEWEIVKSFGYSRAKKTYYNA